MPFLLLPYRSGVFAAANKHFARRKNQPKKAQQKGTGWGSLLATVYGRYSHTPTSDTSFPTSNSTPTNWMTSISNM